MPIVWNKKHARRIPTDAVYVGRPTKWGNPFSHIPPSKYVHVNVKWRVETREEAITEYERWIWSPAQDTLRADMRRELAGKDLVCWCAPLDCHANIIAEIANSVTIWVDPTTCTAWLIPPRHQRAQGNEGHECGRPALSGTNRCRRHTHPPKEKTNV